jgi:hypothetical protein
MFQIWTVLRMLLLVFIGIPLAIAAAAIIFALWLPLIPLWSMLLICHNLEDGMWAFLKTNFNVMVYFYGGPVLVAAGIASVCINLALATPLLPVFLAMYFYHRSHDLDFDVLCDRCWKVLRMYFLVICVAVYAAPVICIVTAAASCVIFIQIILLPRTYVMYRDLESWDFFVDDCRAIFELFLQLIGTIPASLIALATFPLVAALFVIHQSDNVCFVPTRLQCCGVISYYALQDN